MPFEKTCYVKSLCNIEINNAVPNPVALPWLFDGPDISICNHLGPASGKWLAINCPAQEACAFEFYTLPKLYFKNTYSIEAAIHNRIVRVRSRSDRRIRSPDKGKFIKKKTKFSLN